MAKYSVILRGENFLLNRNGKVENLGFVTTQNGTANTVEEAKILAIKNVAEDKGFVKTGGD